MNFTWEQESLIGLYCTSTRVKENAFSFSVFELQSATSRVIMNVPEDVDADLEKLNHNIRSEESGNLLCYLQTKYSGILAQIQEKPVVNGSTLQRDTLGQALLPEDIPVLSKTSRLVAYQSPGNGDCLFNSCSRLLVGDDSLSSCLRVLTALEILSNKEYYSEHPKIEEAVRTNATRYSESTLFSLCLARLGPSNLKDNGNRLMAIVEEAQGKSKLWQEILF